MQKKYPSRADPGAPTPGSTPIPPANEPPSGRELSAQVPGLYGVDRAGRITFANRAALRALGHSRETDVVGAAAQQLIHPADEQSRLVAAEASFLQQAYELADSLDDWETVFRRADGELFDVECNVRPQFQGDRCTGSVVAFRDITERKRFEAELQWQLQHDHLTRLYNRRHFEQQLEQELIRLRRSSELSALLFIDLDHSRCWMPATSPS
jgi:PAS domain S-box-containing protein